MKTKITIALFLIPLVFAALWLGFIFGTMPKLVNFDKCFTAKMNNVEVCPNSPRYAKLDEISKSLLDAIVISEDAGFWHHDGLDWHELKVSMKVNFKSLGFKRGGSTISQQLIKNIHFAGKKTLTRKMKEALLAIEMEKKYSKKLILEKYLNTVEFGPDIYGIKPAANHYFSKPPSQLSVLESAFLAFLLPNPKGYYVNFQNGQLSEFARKMILLINKRLYFYKKVSAEEYSHAKTNIDRFPWYGVIDYDYGLNDTMDLESMDEESLEDEFQKIIQEDIPVKEEIPVEEQLAN